MRKIFYIALLFLLVGIAKPSNSNKITHKGEIMSANGKFEVNLEAQKDDDAPAGRMTIKKTYSGDLIGSGVGQMISKRTSGGSAVYYAIEEFKGTVNGKTGAFTLIHSGSMGKESQSLNIVILEGSGEGELKNITGSMSIVQDGGDHTYELKYEL